ncbi:ribosomal protein L7/L12 [Catenuloplanes nepalensis]|uniref:Ribosomal protein L7/L12 n=1 Tax=Catenuloplanes nepalensis TaxID=587533 RepID=A0ABT9MW06_9ACTN|nr:hypothetical protein [Catenuloplanes nepalensis]MDP9795629.1 ribosomal protein L7/L12 [Catenuloplanes nepalensis]
MEPLLGAALATLFGFALGLTVALGATSRSRIETPARLAAIERQQRAILDHLGVAPPSYPDVVELAGQGRSIEAIRLYRQHTGASLVEAKRFVDGLRTR